MGEGGELFSPDNKRPTSYCHEFPNSADKARLEQGTQPPSSCFVVNSSSRLGVFISATLGLLPRLHQWNPHRGMSGSWDRVVSVFLTAQRVRTSSSRLKLLAGKTSLKASYQEPSIHIVVKTTIRVISHEASI